MSEALSAIIAMAVIYLSYRLYRVEKFLNDYRAQMSAELSTAQELKAAYQQLAEVRYGDFDWRARAEVFQHHVKLLQEENAALVVKDNAHLARETQQAEQLASQANLIKGLHDQIESLKDELRLCVAELQSHGYQKPSPSRRWRDTERQ